MSYLSAAVAATMGIVGAIAGPRIAARWRSRPALTALPRVDVMIHSHFSPLALDRLRVSEREFPYHVRADLQQSMEGHFGRSDAIVYFSGVRRQYHHEQMTFADLLHSEHYPPEGVPPEYEEVEIGESQPVRCLKNGLWLLRAGGVPYGVLVTLTRQYGVAPTLKFQVATTNDAAGAEITSEFFRCLEEAVRRAASYRGKILSLERADSYSGRSSGITVHKLHAVDRDQIILPASTLELLERNVIRFVQQRERLAALGQSTKKGLLFYGPPGTGKTHTIHYLARALGGHTTLLISAEQVALLDEYMTLARLLQPSLVVLEDVDLIARDRAQMDSPCEEVLLNKLLNEMDGLKENVDVMFILTTNRPEALEFALASRPGRVDQAIEFPLPDAEGREKLIRLYAKGIEISPEVVANLVNRTAGVSAAFIKELLRRATQFHLERADTGTIELPDIDEALGEMLFRGGLLNQKILGAESHTVGSQTAAS